MPDYFTYQYNRMVDGVCKLNNPERVIITPHPNAELIAQVEDVNAKELFTQLFPPTESSKSFHEELVESNIFKDCITDIYMSGEICTVRFSKELTPEEIAELDDMVEAHKNNT